MAWTRINVLAEGHAEVQFCKAALAPHLAGFELGLTPILVMTSRKHHQRGGVQRYAKVKADIERQLSAQPGAYLSTMFDLFRLPTDFPKKNECMELNGPREQVECIERALAEDIDSRMFIPYVQLHEFEALLYCDLDVLIPRIEGSAKGVAALKQEVAEIEPEAVNGRSATSPSNRIIEHIPIYKRNKKRVGGPAAAAIPLARLREKCPHFGAWLVKLESLASR